MKLTEAIEKESQLESWMRARKGVLVAYSGGVDSSYLALIATKVLGTERAISVTGLSPSVSDHQLAVAREVVASNGFEHVTLGTKEISNSKYRANDGIRCFYCKDELYARLNLLRDQMYTGFVLVDGTNADDLKDIRHGLRAAEEHDVISPLAILGFSKEMIRERSRFHGLKTWDMPASPCLASRVQVGVEVTERRLNLVEKGEEIIRDAGFREFRLRVDNDSALIQISTDEMNEAGFSGKIENLPDKIKSLGFVDVGIDEDGYRMGSANRRGGLVRHKIGQFGSSS